MEHDKDTASCGCCEAPVTPTPETVSNRPGLTAIAYRVGRYASFRQAMIEAISRHETLRNWTARDSDDYGIALLEMWAYVGDILTFYQERIANEAFLNTARWQASVRQLTALIDYAPAAGKAATARLVFTLEKDASVDIPIGLRVQSVPGQDEKPQKFETVDAVSAHGKLNKLRILPPLQADTPLAVGRGQGLLDAGVQQPMLAPGESLVAVGGGFVEEKVVTASKTVDDRTYLQWTPPMQSALTGGYMYKTTATLRLFGFGFPSTYLKGEPASPGSREVVWSEIDLVAGNAFVAASGATTLTLNKVYNDLKTGVLILIATPTLLQLARVSAVKETAAVITTTSTTVEALSATVTQVTLHPGLASSISDARDALVHVLQEPVLSFRNFDYPGTINSGTETVYIPLATLNSLDEDRVLILDDKAKRPQTVTVTLAKADDLDGDGTDDHLAVSFTPALTRDLDIFTAVMYGNVVKTTHGETIKDELLGSGDASTPFQTFTLKKSPVTYIPQAGASNGVANTLEVRVDGVLWQEVDDFYGRSRTERIFTTSRDEEDAMTLHFGDGYNGARLISGRNNVVASYRQGIGSDGNVKAEKLTNLLDRPVGLKKATNPSAAQGGVDAESLKQMRDNAPNTVRTLGRIVSLRDFEDAARAYTGVAKARASWLWRGMQQAISLVVAGDKATQIIGEAYDNLLADLNSRRDLNRPLDVTNYNAIPVQVGALLYVDTAYEGEDVAEASRDALEDYFAFNNLDLGQAIHLSDVYQVLQAVTGVSAANVTLLQFKRAADRATHDATSDPLQTHLRILASELATIEAITDITLTWECAS